VTGFVSDLFCLRRLIRASCAFVAPLSFELHLTFGRDTPLSCAFDTGTEKTAVKTDLVSRAERIPARQPQQTLPCEKMRTHRPLPSKQVMNKKFDQKEESTIFVLLGFPRLVKKNLSFHHEFFLQSFCLLACARNFLVGSAPINVLLTPENSRNRDFMQSPAAWAVDGKEEKRTKSKDGVW